MKLRNKKTGDAVYVDFQIPLSHNNEVIGCYSVTSLKELNESFEDYKPVEPLIKDDKIRKAVRAWAEANELKPDYEVKYDADRYGLISWQTDISFNFRIEGLEHNKKYIITELCGEEEE